MTDVYFYFNDTPGREKTINAIVYKRIKNPVANQIEKKFQTTDNLVPEAIKDKKKYRLKDDESGIEKRPGFKYSSEKADDAKSSYLAQLANDGYPDINASGDYSTEDIIEFYDRKFSLLSTNSEKFEFLKNLTSLHLRKLDWVHFKTEPEI